MESKRRGQLEVGSVTKGTGLNLTKRGCGERTSSFVAKEDKPVPFIWHDSCRR